MKRIEWECQGRRFAVETDYFSLRRISYGWVALHLCPPDDGMTHLTLPPGTELEVREVG